MDTIEAIEEKIEQAQAEYNAVVHKDIALSKAASDKLKGLKRALSDAIVDGAEPCPTCGAKPHGIRQPYGFSIGCLACQDHRAKGERRLKAIRAWNAGPKGWIKVDSLAKDSKLAALLAKLELKPSVITKNAESEELAS